VFFFFCTHISFHFFLLLSLNFIFIFFCNLLFEVMFMFLNFFWCACSHVREMFENILILNEILIL
jgi:hypothetical protein